MIQTIENLVEKWFKRTPEILEITPQSGVAGQEIKILGKGFQRFQAGKSLVKVGTQDIQPDFWSDSEIRFPLPQLEPGQYSITVEIGKRICIAENKVTVNLLPPEISTMVQAGKKDLVLFFPFGIDQPGNPEFNSLVAQLQKSTENQEELSERIIFKLWPQQLSRLLSIEDVIAIASEHQATIITLITPEAPKVFSVQFFTCESPLESGGKYPFLGAKSWQFSLSDNEQIPALSNFFLALLYFQKANYSLAQQKLTESYQLLSMKDKDYQYADIHFLWGLVNKQRADELLLGQEPLSKERELGQSLLCESEEHLLNALKRYQALNQLSEVARCQLSLSWIRYSQHSHANSLSEALSLLSEAKSLNCTALEALDATSYTIDCAEGYLNLANINFMQATYQQGDTAEDFLDKVLFTLKTAEFLVKQLGNVYQEAVLKKIRSLTLGERYQGNRDENLLDAIALAEHILPIFLNQQDDYPLDAPLLCNLLGKCYWSVSGDYLPSGIIGFGGKGERPWFLQQANQSYTLGIQLVDQQRFPNLTQILEQGRDTTIALLNAQNYSLPDQECVSRYQQKIQTHITAYNLTKALEQGWEFLQWSWSLPRAPNLHTANAHGILGQIYEGQNLPDVASKHYYTSLALFKGIPSSQRVSDATLTGIQKSLERTLSQTKQSDSISEIIKQTDNAYQNAVSACQQGRSLLETNPQAAFSAFQTADTFLPYSPEAIFTLAQFFAFTENWQQAIEYLNLYLRILPRFVTGYQLRAECYQKLGDLNKTIQDLEMAYQYSTNEEEKQSLQQKIAALKKE